MAYDACASTTCAPAPLLSPLTTRQWQDRSAFPTHHPSLFTQQRRFLIASEPELKINRTSSKQTRKYFLIATFYGCLGHAPHFATRQSHITTHAFLIATQIIRKRANPLEANEKTFSNRYS
jgi:hypothetical protein